MGRSGKGPLEVDEIAFKFDSFGSQNTKFIIGLIAKSSCGLVAFDACEFVDIVYLTEYLVQLEQDLVALETEEIAIPPFAI